MAIMLSCACYNNDWLPELLMVSSCKTMFDVKKCHVPICYKTLCPGHSRFGYRPSWYCSDFLCKRKRWTKTGNLVKVGWKENSQREKAELSCYEVWYTFNVLPTIHTAYSTNVTLVAPAPRSWLVPSLCLTARISKHTYKIDYIYIIVSDRMALRIQCSACLRML